MNFKSQIRFSEINRDNKRVTITRSQLVQAVNWTDAEKILYEQYDGENFTIIRIDPFKVQDVFQTEEVQDYYLCEVEFTTENDKGKEKKFIQNMLVSASSVPDATQRIHDELERMLIPYEVKDVNKSPITEVFLMGEIQDDVPELNHGEAERN